MYAYDFEGKRYDVGDKLGFLQATVEYALRKDDLREPFIEYLKGLSEKFNEEITVNEADNNSNEE